MAKNLMADMYDWSRLPDDAEWGNLASVNFTGDGALNAEFNEAEGGRAVGFEYVGSAPVAGDSLSFSIEYSPYFYEGPVYLVLYDASFALLPFTPYEITPDDAPANMSIGSAFLEGLRYLAVVPDPYGTVPFGLGYNGVYRIVGAVPDQPPACFWTDLVNVKQECEEAPVEGCYAISIRNGYIVYPSDAIPEWWGEQQVELEYDFGGEQGWYAFFYDEIENRYIGDIQYYECDTSYPNTQVRWYENAGAGPLRTGCVDLEVGCH